jgi:hypothetical protein
MATAIQLLPDEPALGSPDQGGRSTTTTTAVPGGFAGRLARTSVATARADGAAAAIREMTRTESFLRVFRSHMLAVPCEERGESYGVGLIVIELMILRETRTRGFRVAA